MKLSYLEILNPFFKEFGYNLKEKGFDKFNPEKYCVVENGSGTICWSYTNLTDSLNWVLKRVEGLGLGYITVEAIERLDSLREA